MIPLGRLRCVLIEVLLTAASLGAIRLLLGQVSSPVASAEDAVVGLCVLALVGCAAWAWAAGTAVVVQAVRGAASDAAPWVPHILRRLVLAACGVAAVGALAGPGQAAPAEPDPHRPPLAGVLAGLPMPERAVDAAYHPLAHPAVDRPHRASVVVRRGDSLWSIAVADLGGAASDRQVTARWHRIYALNRAGIGADPDLILPGQRLRLPSAPATAAR